MSNTQKLIDKKEKELKVLKEKLQEEQNKVEFIIIDGWAYETKEHDFNKKLSEITIPKGKELWLPSETYKFYEDKELKNKLNLNNCWFFVKQPRENTNDIARFCAYSYFANLNCNFNSSDSGSDLGVRYKFKINKNGK